MQLKDVVGAFAFSTLIMTGACLVDGEARVVAPAPVVAVEVEAEPPPPVEVVTEVRPGFVYIQGRHEWVGGRWVWRKGYYERERVGHVYVQGHWDRRGRRHVWVEGHWQRR
jgi:YXWGXW repeat-containing protein